MTTSKPYRLIITGGGTGGHIYPALTIAHAFKERYPQSEILFVGAIGKMEMIKVPQAGYKIIGLTISGIQRKLTLSNLLVPFKLLSSYLKAIKIINDFKPNVLIGTGGYASGPAMLAASHLKVPYLIQEQNSYAGLTNKKLAAKAMRVCVAYPSMDNYFPKEKLVFTGNPVRRDIEASGLKRNEALHFFGFNSNQKTLLIIGGSLGARTINTSLLAGINKLLNTGVQVIWQTGKVYFNDIKGQLNALESNALKLVDFLERMDFAYAAADVVISRAGALSISELCVAKKASILVPSPNVAEDHQSKNAMALVRNKAAVLITDHEAPQKLVDEAIELLFNEPRGEELRANIAAFAKPDAANDIVNEIEQLIDGTK